MGHTCKIETQGSIGVENQLTPEEIAAADAVCWRWTSRSAGWSVQGQTHGEGIHRGRHQNPVGLLKSLEKALAQQKK